MLTVEQMLSYGRKHKRYLEGVIYIECMTHGISKVPRLEVDKDNAIFFDSIENRIHIGVGGLHAEDEIDFFEQAYFLLGHELQHMLSTTQKDWNAAIKLCFKEACQRLSIKVFGKTSRLTKDSDYDAFFRDLASRDIYVNKGMILDCAHFCLNSLEDGRIENIRQVKNPGFGDYRKIWNGKQWLKNDATSTPYFKEDSDDLDAFGELATIMNQLLSLSLHAVYQRGFLDVYEGTKLHRRVQSYIPSISKAVLAKTCRECMDQARSIFNRVLDLLLETCTCEITAQEVEQLLKNLLEQLMNEAANAHMSATPNTEEKGEGVPAESLFGQSELELELTKEEYEELMQNADEADDDSVPSVKIKIKDEEADADEAEEKERSSSSEEGSSMESAEEAENSPSAASNDGSKDGDEDNGDGNGQEETSSEGKKDASSEGESEKSDSDDAGYESGDSDPNSDDGDSDGDNLLDVGKANNKGINNRNKGCSSSAEGKDVSEEVRKAMEEAAQNATGDFDIAEADAKLNEQFREAASRFQAVQPAEFDRESVDSAYDYDVEFEENTRIYSPTERLPLELENKGKSLDRAVDQLVRNKMEPDLRFLKSGKLDTRRLANLGMGEINVFKKNGEPQKTDVAAFLLMDNSGSMGDGPGSTRYACCNAFAVLEEGFKRHMALKIAAFDAWGDDHVMHEVIKEFDEVAGPNLSYNFRNLGRSGYGNKDGYSIRVATRQLLQRSEKDKILIIASDGFPTEYRGGHSEGCEDVKSAVEEARKAGIRTIGMYMFHEQNDGDFAEYQNMYGPEIIFAGLEEIGDELTRILKRYF